MNISNSLIKAVEITFFIQLSIYFISSTSNDVIKLDIYKQTLLITFETGTYDISVTNKRSTNNLKTGSSPEPFILFAICGTESSGNQDRCDLRYTYCDEALDYKCQDCASLCSPLRTTGSESVKESCIRHCSYYLFFKQFQAQTNSSKSERLNVVEYVNGNNINQNQSEIVIILSISLVTAVILLILICLRLLSFRYKLANRPTLWQTVVGKISKQGEPLIEEDYKGEDDLVKVLKGESDFVNKNNNNVQDHIVPAGSTETTAIPTIQDRSTNHNNQGCDLPGNSSRHCNVQTDTEAQPIPTRPLVEETAASPMFQPTENTDLKHPEGICIKETLQCAPSDQLCTEPPGEGYQYQPHDERPDLGDPTVQTAMRDRKLYNQDTSHCPRGSATLTGISQDPFDVMQHTNDTEHPDSGHGTYKDMQILVKCTDPSYRVKESESLMQQIY